MSDFEFHGNCHSDSPSLCTGIHEFWFVLSTVIVLSLVKFGTRYQHIMLMSICEFHAHRCRESFTFVRGTN